MTTTCTTNITSTKILPLLTQSFSQITQESQGSQSYSLGYLIHFDSVLLLIDEGARGIVSYKIRTTRYLLNSQRSP